MLTLEKLLFDTQLSSLFEELHETHQDQSIDNTVYLFNKIKYLLRIRELLLAIIKETMVKEQTLICLKKLLLLGKVDKNNLEKLKRFKEDYNPPKIQNMINSEDTDEVNLHKV
mmetsp:Transcript_26858/g.23715  ORF Transcript_26858/g.23715 Transcript_26858/m.23715 type:complete len:113 (+) Transcript_26858:1044-1382(+)